MCFRIHAFNKKNYFPIQVLATALLILRYWQFHIFGVTNYIQYFNMENYKPNKIGKFIVIIILLYKLFHTIFSLVNNIFIIIAG